MTSPGCVFDPSDGEIVSYYLPKLIEGNGDLGFLGDLYYVFNVCSVYSTKPSILFDLGINILNNYDMLLHPCLKANQRFFFSNRKTIAHKNANGKRPRRTLQHERDKENGEGGFWKSSTGEKPIFDDDHNLILGYVNMLNFYDYSNNQSSSHEKKNRKNAKKSSWIMYEYRLPGDRFQEWVVCKIKDSCRGEEDQREVFWLDYLFFSDGGGQTLAANKSIILPQHMQEQEYPSYQPLSDNLVALQAEAAPNSNLVALQAEAVPNSYQQLSDNLVALQAEAVTNSYQPWSDNLVALQAEAVPNSNIDYGYAGLTMPDSNIDYGYAGLIRNGEQGGDICINHPNLMETEMETKPDEDEDDAAETRRIALEIEAELGVQFTFDSDDGYFEPIF